MKKVVIYHTNDIHSNYKNVAKIVSYLNKNIDENSLLLDAGDFIDFSSDLNYVSKGKCGAKLLDLCKYDAITIGNNEGFNLRKVVENVASKRNTKFLSCNLKTKKGQSLKNILPSIIIKKNDIRFLIIGATPFAQSYNEYFKLFGLVSVSPYECIKKELEIHQGKFDFVILLSHIGLKREKELAESNLPIDLIISGHNHEVIALERHHNTYIHQVGYNGKYLGKIELSFDSKNNYQISGKEIKIKNYKIDLKINEFLIKQTSGFNKKLTKKMFSIPVKLKTSKYKENSLTNFLCDAMIATKKGDLSIINSGMADMSLKTTNFSCKDLLKINNSPIVLAKSELLGKDIYEALELSLNKEYCLKDGHGPGFRGKFLGKLHVSSNVRVDYQKDKILNIYINNEKIKMNKKYSVITTDFLIRGVYYSSLSNGKNTKYYKKTVRDLLLKYLQDDALLWQAQIKRYWEVSYEI